MQTAKGFLGCPLSHYYSCAGGDNTAVEAGEEGVREGEGDADRKCVQFGAFCKLRIKPISDQARKRKGRALRQ